MAQINCINQLLCAPSWHCVFILFSFNLLFTVLWPIQDIHGLFRIFWVITAMILIMPASLISKSSKLRVDFVSVRPENKVKHKFCTRCLEKWSRMFYCPDFILSRQTRSLNQLRVDRHFNYMVNFKIFLYSLAERLSTVMYSRFGIKFFLFFGLYSKWHNC